MKYNWRYGENTNRREIVIVNTIGDIVKTQTAGKNGTPEINLSSIFIYAINKAKASFIE